MIGRVMEKILVVGAGLTGATTTSVLAREVPKCVSLSVWDKSNGTGGRMSTSRSPQDARCTVDLGAQYISATPEYYKKHRSFYEELLKENLICPMRCKLEGEKPHQEGTRHFVTPQGISSIVKHFLKNHQSLTIEREHLLEDLSLKNKRWEARTKQGHSECFDCVVLTMPVPQILQLQGTVKTLIDASPDVQEKLRNVQYSSRFALGLFYDEGTVIDLPWDAKYFYDNPCIRFVSVDNKKRSGDQPAPSVMVHTSVPFSLQHLEEDKDAIGPTILQNLRELLPSLPAPSHVKNHKWRYSQVHKVYEGTPGCVVLSEDPLLILAGDAFIHSNFDGCVESASSAAAVILQKLNTEQSNL